MGYKYFKEFIVIKILMQNTCINQQQHTIEKCLKG